MAKKESERDAQFLAALSAEKDKYDQIEVVDVSKKMRQSFLDYSMSVIVARALPDIRDGLKPVQRRILYGMNCLHIYANTPFKKSARITGEVMGKYHPHGDSSIYEAMVRMAQPFSYRYVLVDGHGNFGNIDGDGAAASRYTEARMSKISMEMLRDIDKNTVDFVDNYDGEEKEPTILPARIPNLLINGSTGIAVGMATNIPPHNLGETIDGVFALMDNPEITCDELMKYIPGPDFPTGGIILGGKGLRKAYNTGLGIIYVRSKAEVEELSNGKNQIVVTEIPYMVNKTKLLERIADIVKDKIVDGITDLRDESNREGIRIVIELRKDVNPHVMLNNLYKYTQLQTSFGYNMIALVDGQPKTVNLKVILEEYLKHQINVITRRTQFDLEKTQAREHILRGLVIALENIDAVIELIKKAKDSNEALDDLMANYLLDDIQAREILNTKLQRLTGLEVEKIKSEEEQCLKDIENYKSILASEDKKLQIIRDELTEIKAKYNDPRLSEISTSTEISIDDEDLIPVEDCLVTVTNKGYAKRIKLSEYKAQGRGGKGLTGMKTHDDDAVKHLIPASSHDFLLFFTNQGRVYIKKTYNIQEGTRISKGVPLVNLINFQEDEKLSAICPVHAIDDDDSYIFFATKKGLIKRLKVSTYANVRSNGLRTITLNEGDELLDAVLLKEGQQIILAASNGKALRLDPMQIRVQGRSAMGVIGMRFQEGEQLVGVDVVNSDDDEVLVITDKGYGKRTKASEYALHNRGGQGMKTLQLKEKNGNLACLAVVNDTLDLIATTNKGMIIRVHVSDIALSSRSTQGVIIMRLKSGQSVESFAVVDREEDEEELENQNENNEEVTEKVQDTEEVAETPETVEPVIA